MGQVVPRPAFGGRVPRRMRAVLLLGLASWSCAARSARPPAPPLTEIEAVRLLEETAAASGRVRRYQAVIGIRGEGSEGRFSGRLLVVFARPPEAGDPAAVDALRLELFAPVGGSRWTLVAGPDRARLVVPAERAFAEGRQLEEFTGPLLGVAVGLEEIAALLTGSGAPLRGGDGVRPSSGGGSAVLADGTELSWDSPVPPAQLRRAVTSDYEAEYPGDYRRRRRQVPRRVEIASAETRATLTVEDLEVNAELHPDSFRLRIPDDFQRAAVRDLSRDSRLPKR